MRLLLVVLMMVLLPLRAGLGDVMAMAHDRSQAPSAMQPAATHDCHETRQRAVVDRTAHHAPRAVADDATQADPACSDCTVCHAAALPGTPLPRVPAQDGNAPPLARVLPHLSAETAPSLKPPIA